MVTSINGVIILRPDELDKIRVYGLSIRQVASLIDYYEINTGKLAEDIDPKPE